MVFNWTLGHTWEITSIIQNVDPGDIIKSSNTDIGVVLNTDQLQFSERLHEIVMKTD